MTVSILKWIFKNIVVRFTTGFPPDNEPAARSWVLRNWEKYVIPFVEITTNKIDDRLAAVMLGVVSNDSLWPVVWRVIQGEIDVTLGTLIGTESGVLGKVKALIAKIRTGQDKDTSWVGVSEPRKVVLTAMVLGPLFGKPVKINGIDELLTLIESEGE